MRELTVLHTSDWHLGCNFHKRRRYGEHAAFLNWLAQTVQQKHVDLLLISGDVFDSTSPSNASLAQYSDFLNRVTTETNCRVVLTAGNHDSPSGIDALVGVLQRLHIYVVGAAKENPADEVFLVQDHLGDPLAVVAAVPYLREGDIRTIVEGETADDRPELLSRGILHHYELVTKNAKLLQQQSGADIPILAMGHLYALGADPSDWSDSQNLYIGTLGAINIHSLIPAFDYLALGHLHHAQKVGNCDHVRYSGSPLVMDFSECRYEKTCPLLHFGPDGFHMDLITIPTFQEIESLSGNMNELTARLNEMVAKEKPIWVELVQTDDEIVPDFFSRWGNIVRDSAVDIVQIRNKFTDCLNLTENESGPALADMSAFDVFDQLLKKQSYSDEVAESLRSCYRKVMQCIQEEDQQAN